MSTFGIVLLIGLTGIVIAVIVYIKWEHDRKPRVTKKDFEKLKNVSKKLDKWQKDNQKIRKEYNKEQ